MQSSELANLALSGHSSDKVETQYALTMKTREEINAEAKKIRDSFTGIGSTSAVGRTEMKMMEIEIELLLDIRDIVREKLSALTVEKS